MSYHQDWLMRQIETQIVMLRWLLTGRKTHVLQAEDVELNTSSEPNRLQLQLQLLVRQGQLCQAENLLYEALENPDRATLEAGVDFYAALNDFSDEALLRANFSREEVYEGLQALSDIYGLPDML